MAEICRLCLQQSDKFVQISNYVNKKIRFITFHHKIEFCDCCKPYICNTCIQALDFCCNFKQSLVETEDKILGADRRSREPRDLKLLIDHGDLQNDSEICRLCLGIFKCDDTKPSINAKHIKKMLDDIFDVDLTLSNGPRICNCCEEYIQKTRNFIDLILRGKSKNGKKCTREILKDVKIKEEACSSAEEEQLSVDSEEVGLKNEPLLTKENEVDSVTDNGAKMELEDEPLLKKEIDEDAVTDNDLKMESEQDSSKRSTYLDSKEIVLEDEALLKKDNEENSVTDKDFKGEFEEVSLKSSTSPHSKEIELKDEALLKKEIDGDAITDEDCKMEFEEDSLRSSTFSAITLDLSYNLANLGESTADISDGDVTVVQSIDNVEPVRSYTYTCEHCNKFASTDLDSFIKHLHSVHSNDSTQGVKRKKRNYCTYCLTSFSTLNDFRVHNYKVHPDKYPKGTLYECPDCGFCTTRKSDTESHMNSHLEEKQKLRCTLCSFQANEKSVLSEHMTEVHLKPHLSSEKQNGKQKGKRKRGRAIKCGFCDLRFSTNAEYYMHKSVEHPDQCTSTSKTYSCEKCTYTTDTKCAFDLHLTTHAYKFDKNVVECPSCEYTTTCREDLNNHVSTCHIPRPKYNCDKCDFGTNQRPEMREHMKWHKSQYKCAYCDEMFPTQVTLRMHKYEYHAYECRRVGTIYQCEDCSFRTTFKLDINRHKVTHGRTDGARKYSCDKCEFSTYWKAALTKHTSVMHKTEQE